MKKEKQIEQKATVEWILFNGSAKQVRALFVFNRYTKPEDVVQKFHIWSRYFFPKYFTSSDAPNHLIGDIKRARIYQGKRYVFLNIAYRGDAKTTRAKLFRAFVICCDEDHQRKFMRVLSEDVANARQTVTDIYNMLINKRVKALYPEIFEKTEAKREETMGSFTTSTGIKMLAKPIGVDQRGAVQEESRPDFDMYDDFETRKTLRSAVVSQGIWENMKEASDGLAKGGVAEYTCNYISERGNVHRLVLTIEDEDKMITPIGHKVKGKWVPTWDRYTTDDIRRLEKTKEDFEGEYLCKPAASKDMYFAREEVDKQVPKEIIDEIGGLKFFRKVNPEHRMSSGNDVGGGVGLDSSANVIIDHDVIPAQVIATYKTNEVKPDAYAIVISKQNKKYFHACYTAIEKNYGSTNDIFKQNYPTAMIHKTQRSVGKVRFAKAIEYGWHTNSATKPMMLADFCKAVEDGLIELNDPDLIAEVRSYTTGDLMEGNVDVRQTTRHFDLLMAAAIAWYVRKFVKAPIIKVRGVEYPWNKASGNLNSWSTSDHKRISPR